MGRIQWETSLGRKLTTSVEMWCQVLVGDVVFPHVFFPKAETELGINETNCLSFHGIAKIWMHYDELWWIIVVLHQPKTATPKSCKNGYLTIKNGPRFKYAEMYLLAKKNQRTDSLAEPIEYGAVPLKLFNGI